ncbi:MAG TPA: DUF2752 domain-containing protein [Chthoniobacterales bacterium]|nr:DUF2752 domain-containing protein [Chthoniobacterales bacterium]
MIGSPRHPRLRSGARQWRAINLALLPVGLLALAWLPPSHLPRWFPFATSCGAITGLPCIFCGTTRALHCLFQGEFGRALYFNWLAYPLLAGAVVLLIINAFEMATNCNLLARFPRPRLTGARCCALAAALLLLWCLQVYLAVSRHKTELLNPQGPLYSLVIR